MGIGVSNGNVGLAVDPDVRLFLPADDIESPEVSIVIPALNEQLTIADFVAWCREGLRGPVPWARSSSSTAPPTAPRELALAGGARVLKAPKRGLGRAYIDASRTSAASTCSWAMRTARTTSASSSRSSTKFRERRSSSSWGRASGAPSSRARCPRCTGTSARR